MRERERLCCLTSTEASRPIRDGDEWEKAPTRKTKAAVDRRQSNKMTSQCPSGIAPHHAIAVPTVMQNRVTKTMSVAPPLGNNRSKRSPALSLAQHHLPALDLFWASCFVRVQDLAFGCEIVTKPSNFDDSVFFSFFLFFFTTCSRMRAVKN